MFSGRVLMNLDTKVKGGVQDLTTGSLCRSEPKVDPDVKEASLDVWKKWTNLVNVEGEGRVETTAVKSRRDPPAPPHGGVVMGIPGGGGVINPEH